MPTTLRAWLGLDGQAWFLSDHRRMAKANTVVHNTETGEFVSGRSVATLGRGMSLIKVGKPTKGAVRPEEKTTVLVMKAARALNKPGIDKSVVFQGPNAAKIYSYSVYPQDTSKVIRESANGARVVGRLIDGKFRVVKA